MRSAVITPSHSRKGLIPTRCVAQAWFGRDYGRLVIKAEGDYADGDIEELSMELLYGLAAASWFQCKGGHGRMIIRPYGCKPVGTGEQLFAPVSGKIHT